MLQRLYASLVHGPSMNARPHRSRQRCDLMELACFRGTAPESAVAALLEKGKVEFAAKVPPFRQEEAEGEAADKLTAEQRAERDAWLAQSRLLRKLRDMAEDAANYFNDHGESCLALGFPLLSMPAPEEAGGKRSGRILAPLILVPVELTVRTASRPGITLTCSGEGADRLVANPALLAWLERQTGSDAGELFRDEEGEDPWREMAELLTKISSLVSLETPAAFTPETLLSAVPATEELPRRATVLHSAVLGLFPLSNQSLLRDTLWMQENESGLAEPVRAFLSPAALEGDGEGESEAPVAVTARDFASEWLVAQADPCQAAAVFAAREAKTLVVHGPPGTGKSQTITNIIADHLARRERVLFVCDKRTALDVVKYRLDAAGLGDLCGVVHDPGADRRDFYMSLRERLENLADTPVPADPGPQLDSVNRRLAEAHSLLEAHRRRLHVSPDGTAPSFHDLLGQWLALSQRPEIPAITLEPGVTTAVLESAHTLIEEIARRAAAAGYGTHPLRGLHTLSLTEVLSKSPAEVAANFATLTELGKAADALRPGEAVLEPGTSLELPAAQLRGLAQRLRTAAAPENAEAAARFRALPAAARLSWLAAYRDTAELRAACHSQPLDRTFLDSVREAGFLTPAAVMQQVSALEAWQQVSGSFFRRLFAGSQKRAAAAALLPLGLSLPGGVVQGLTYYRALLLRLKLGELFAAATGAPALTVPDDVTFHSAVESAQSVCLALEEWPAARGAFPADSSSLTAAADSLTAVAAWADALRRLETAVAGCGWFRPGAAEASSARWAAGESAAAMTGAWSDGARTLEELVRCSAALEQLPASLRPAVEGMAATAVPGPVMREALTKAAVEQELRRRLQEDAALASLDGDQMEAAFETLHELAEQKRELVRQSLRRSWLAWQRERLLSGTGSQLNRHGTALRQRLYVKGKKALKLRQMLLTGVESEGGDPVYDLCPVWMASPSTVAQIFPRTPLFDVIIFDEASQCRLEEALPVLLRGRRVVIAGDQKQLPPTRFFESAVADTTDDSAESAEDLFVQQQSDAGDLLTAALNLEVREACLDVHYRSRHEALIGFSNAHYYNSRLQPVPGHPRHAARAPLYVHRTAGVYEDRTNRKEAAEVVELVAELLAAENPPSIGVACFNLSQRHAILDAFDAKSAADEGFARRLEAARTRRGKDSFEGLFVKNLENVQGDERDVMIISTTFGPDAGGKFRRNFGALSQQDGGRRLNVLITRARQAVHVFTSIPPEEYASVPEAPPGMIPGGRLQLYAYLRYAESLASAAATPPEGVPALTVRATATPSPVAEALGHSLTSRTGAGAVVYWGNDGFCIDVVCRAGDAPGGVTCGVLSDFSRFHKTPDPIEWDLFRTRMLRAQGWSLEQVWAPVLFRRGEDAFRPVLQRHTQNLTK